MGDRRFLSTPVAGLGDQSVLDYFASRGFVAASPSYRLAPGARFPAQIEDCKAAIRWIRAHAAKYRVDPERIAAGGYSSGGHLACLLGVTEPSDGLEGTGGHAEHSSRVQAVVDLFGPTDLLSDDWTPHVETSILQPLIGATRADKPELYRRASPVCYLQKDRRPPPFLVLHGAADRVVHPNQSKRFVTRLTELGAKARYVEVDGEGHGWYGAKLAATLDDVIEFLREQLR
jgi:acetyl esterase/lipase